MPEKYDALLFDLDDTLLVEDASVEKAFLETCRLAVPRHGIDPQELHASVRLACREIWLASPLHPYFQSIGISSWEGLWGKFTGDDPDLRALREWSPAYRHDSWEAALGWFSIRDEALVCELAEAFPRLRRELNVVFEDVRPVLDRLRGRYRLGLVTNGAPDLQHGKVDASGLGEYFQQVAVSGDIGIGKPDRRIFDILLERLGSSPDRALMIGNSLKSDIAGAHAAGMKAVWVNRFDYPRVAAILPDWEITGLDQPDAILAEL